MLRRWPWRGGTSQPTLWGMCGRFALSLTPADLAQVFATCNALPNVAPS